MGELFIVTKQSPAEYCASKLQTDAVVNDGPWNHYQFAIGNVIVKGRQSWGAPAPRWRNELVYYNTAEVPLEMILNKIIVHHTNNNDSILANETKQQGRGYVLLGYHFFIAKDGSIFEGRPLEVMGSHAGEGNTSGPLNDPDWGAVGIVLQGDYHRADDWISSDEIPDAQMASLEKLVVALSNQYRIRRLLMHREVERAGSSTVCPGDHLAKSVAALRQKLGLSGKDE